MPGIILNALDSMRTGLSLLPFYRWGNLRPRQVRWVSPRSYRWCVGESAIERSVQLWEPIFLTPALCFLYIWGALVVCAMYCSLGLINSLNPHSSAKECGCWCCLCARCCWVVCQDHHSQWPGQNLNQDPVGSRAHVPALHVTAFVLAVFGFGLIDVSAFRIPSHLAW